MTYDQLTPQQKNEVHYLFSDECFDQSPEPYDYEVNKYGDVTGRKPLIVVNASRKGDDHSEAVVRADPNPTEGQIGRADAASTFLAERIIRALAIATAEHETAHAQ